MQAAFWSPGGSEYKIPVQLQENGTCDKPNESDYI